MAGTQTKYRQQNKTIFRKHKTNANTHTNSQNKKKCNRNDNGKDNRRSKQTNKLENKQTLPPTLPKQKKLPILPCRYSSKHYRHLGNQTNSTCLTHLSTQSIPKPPFQTTSSYLPILDHRPNSHCQHTTPSTFPFWTTLQIKLPSYATPHTLSHSHHHNTNEPLFHTHALVQTTPLLTLEHTHIFPHTHLSTDQPPICNRIQRLC